MLKTDRPWTEERVIRDVRLVGFPSRSWKLKDAVSCTDFPIVAELCLSEQSKTVQLEVIADFHLMHEFNAREIYDFYILRKPHS